MNLLAHAVLSPDVETVRVGNVLADFIRRNEIEALEPALRVGVELHRTIDRFTDNHAVVGTSKARLIAFQRFANPLIDVFYDHFLTRHWAYEVDVPQYVARLYQEIENHKSLLPIECVRIAERMIEQDWLSQYGTFDGLRLNLERMSKRIEYTTGRTVSLADSLQMLEVRYDDFEADFLEFWPQLRAHVDASFRLE